jgi:hypothetical protein
MWRRRRLRWLALARPVSVCLSVLFSLRACACLHAHASHVPCLTFFEPPVHLRACICARAQVKPEEKQTLREFVSVRVYELMHAEKVARETLLTELAAVRDLQVAANEVGTQQNQETNTHKMSMRMHAYAFACRSTRS